MIVVSNSSWELLLPVNGHMSQADDYCLQQQLGVIVTCVWTHELLLPVDGHMSQADDCC